MSLTDNSFEPLQKTAIFMNIFFAIFAGLIEADQLKAYSVQQINECHRETH